MGSEPQHMPHAVLAAAIPVLCYSFFCLFLGFLLVTVLFKTRDGFNCELLLSLSSTSANPSKDVTLFALATTCTTIVSIIQQCNYIANWHDLRIQQYEQSLIVKGNPALALGPLSRGFNAVLFWTILYFYNVDSITMLFWYVDVLYHSEISLTRAGQSHWCSVYGTFDQDGFNSGKVSSAGSPRFWQSCFPPYSRGCEKEFRSMLDSLAL